MKTYIDYVNIPFDRKYLKRIFQHTQKYPFTTYISCGAITWILKSRGEFQKIWKKVLTESKTVHNLMCDFATGFSLSKSKNHTVPPHIDIDTPKFYNLLIPVFGTARISIYETIPEQLEFRHNQKHFKMPKKGVPVKKIGEHIVDQPTLLDTNILHSVQPIVTPRCIWCSRWINLPVNFNFQSFKIHLEKTYFKEQ